MRLNEIKYRRCKCGVKYPLASWRTKKCDGGATIYIEIVPHNNPMCRPCLHEKEAEKKGGAA